MLKAVEGISDTKKRITIEIPAEVIESDMQQSLIEVQKKSQVPGFRPGKTPMSIIEKKYGKSIEAEVLEKLIPQFYQKAIEDAGLKPLSQPVVENSSDFVRNASISMTFMVEVRPELENIDYEGIKVNEIPIEVTEGEVENTLKNLLEEKASYESIDDAIISGDLITVDYKTDFEEALSKDVILKVGSGPYPQEFHDALVNRKKEEEFEIEAGFPVDMQSPYAGKTVKFNMTVSDIKRRNIPSIDDDFAVDLGFDNLVVLREKIKESLLSAKSNKAKNLKSSQILDKLIEANNFEVPESLLNAKIDDFIAEIRAMRKDDRPEEELEKEVLPYAERAVRSFIIMEIIGEKEKIEVTEDEMKERVLDIAQSNRVAPDDVVKYYLTRDRSLGALKYSIYEQKVMDLLLSKAEVIKGE